VKTQVLGERVKPQTLGDKLDETMRLRAHTPEAAARVLGVAPTEVLSWAADRQLPDRSHHTALGSYLEIDERELRGLMLRSQMRMAQWRIRD
jgi:LmbE family N-acetylglucosaminyl deacetylase